MSMTADLRSTDITADLRSAEAAFAQSIPLEAYFPTCMLPDCPLADREHSHVLDHQREIMEFGLADYQEHKCHLYCQGGVGSAKSVAFAARTVREMIEVPDNVGVVIRRDWDKLFKTAFLDIKKCIKKLVRLEYIEPPTYSRKHQGDYTKVDFSNDSTLYAVQGKNWTEALGASYGVLWCDDAMELPELLFGGDETSAGLISRLRLPEARFFKNAQSHNINRLVNLVSTNPPPIGHFLHRLFGKEPGIFNLANDVVKHMQVSSLQNPFTGDDYVEGLIAFQEKLHAGGRGNVRQNIERVILGKSKPAYGGVPVYPQFEHSVHVGAYEFNSAYPLVRAWDFGVQHPAVIFSNLYTCDEGTNHYIALSEIAHMFDVTIYDLHAEVIKHTERAYKDAIIIDAGDRAGYRKSSSNKDKRSDMRILIHEFNLPFKHRYFDVLESIKYMRSLLKPKKHCKCGLPHILVSNQCTVLIGALEGGYRFAKNRNTGQIADKPLKDKYFDDVADAWRYGAENCVKWGIDRSVETEVEQRLQRFEHVKPWAWMEEGDKNLLDLLTR